MLKPRKTLVLLEETSYYHCVSRCVQRAFLCGSDSLSGKSYEHRRQWIVDRMKLLAEVFAIDLCAYAVLSNHYHVILHVDTHAATSWSMRCLNEPIARQANQEDGCTGRYWEGRFKSQALLDEKALAACMAYVDLNPVRAGLAETPEQSEYTSLKEQSHIGI
jgi:REP element-mobilizing transposase RayT